LYGLSVIVAELDRVFVLLVKLRSVVELDRVSFTVIELYPVREPDSVSFIVNEFGPVGDKPARGEIVAFRAFAGDPERGGDKDNVAVPIWATFASRRKTGSSNTANNEFVSVSRRPLQNLEFDKM
jgi:hypothetical protein